MTATPIPRTLTLALYGETNVSTLDELPPGRQVTQTFLVPESKREDSYKWIEQKLNQDQQAFVICPLVEDSDKVDAKSAEDEFKRLKKEVYPNKKIALVHGQMKEEEKDRILKEFKNKKYDLLVATPVIEVGIDIPNSTIMIIENAERFGLAQLHQFRGRIGRGDKQGYCYLFANSNNEQAQERLKFFSKTKSGFKVAQYDLKRRGPGEVYGTRQSGMLELKFADLSDNKMIKTAGEIAEKLI
jgi:ATP-dependent DNA helicase RecG